jgi:hypothetical protein
MNLDSIVKELHRQVVKLENWLRRLEDRFQRHLESADDHPLYLLADGTRPLTGEWDIGEDMSVKGERIEARDVEGLRIEDDGGNLGIFVEDGGFVGVGTAAPDARLHVGGSTGEILRLDDSSATGSPFLSFYQSTTRRSYIVHADTNDDFAFVSEFGTLSFWTGTAGTEVLRARFATDGHLTLEDGLRVQVDEVRARDSGGLLLRDDSGTLGVFVEDGGQVGVGTATPAAPLHVGGATGELLRLDDSDASGSPSLTFWQSGTRRSYIVHSDTIDDLAIVSEYNGIAFWTGSAGTEAFRARFGNTGNLEFEDGLRIQVDQVRARDSGGLALYDDGGTGIFVEDGGFVGINGITNPNNALEVQGAWPGAYGQIVVRATTGEWSGFTFYRDTKYGAYFIFRSDDIAIFQNHNDGAFGVTALNPSGGTVAVGATTADGRLDVSQTSTTAAIPTLELQQADLSEEFINFVGTIGAGNSIEADTTPPAAPSHKIRVATNGTFRYIYVYDS